MKQNIQRIIAASYYTIPYMPAGVHSEGRIVSLLTRERDDLGEKAIEILKSLNMTPRERTLFLTYVGSYPQNDERAREPVEEQWGICAEQYYPYTTPENLVVAGCGCNQNKKFLKSKGHQFAKVGCSAIEFDDLVDKIVVEQFGHRLNVEDYKERINAREILRNLNDEITRNCAYFKKIWSGPFRSPNHWVQLLWPADVQSGHPEYWKEEFIQEERKKTKNVQKGIYSWGGTVKTKSERGPPAVIKVGECVPRIDLHPEPDPIILKYPDCNHWKSATYVCDPESYGQITEVVTRIEKAKLESKGIKLDPEKLNIKRVPISCI